LKDEMEGPTTSDTDRGKLSRILCQRRFSVGADGILFIESARDVDCSMRLFEPDGKEADMCGNGIRCVASYLMDRQGKSDVDILTQDGVKHVARVGMQYRVEMGTVRIHRRDLEQYLSDQGDASDILLDLSVQVGNNSMRGSLVNTGEPHLVFMSENIETENIRYVGEAINEDRIRFPRGVNVNYVQVIGPHSIKIRTYERGVYDETMACGTGATASAAVCLLRRQVQHGPVTVITKGGDILVEIDKNYGARMAGPAQAVFEGRLTIDI